MEGSSNGRQRCHVGGRRLGAADGWAHITPCGDFPHSGAGVTQVIDREAYDRIAADFNGLKSDSNFPGVLVDFDHFSLDTDKPSEAAGWITDLETRDGWQSLSGVTPI